MPPKPLHPPFKVCPDPSSTYAQETNARYILFENKRSLLQQKKNALEYEQKRIEAEEKRLDLAKRKVEIQKDRLEAEKNREELRLWEDLFEKALVSMVKIAGVCLESGERERLLRGLEGRVRSVVRDAYGHGDRGAAVKRVKVDGNGEEKQRCESVVKVEQRLEMPDAKVEQKAEVMVPQKRKAACTGFRKAYVESEDDAEYGC